MYKEINVILGERVRSARWKKEMTRELLAEKIGVSPRFLADVEGGKIGVSIQTLKSLSLALSVTADYLLDIGGGEEESFFPIVRLMEEIDVKFYPLIMTLLEQLREIGRQAQ